jgi:HK97 family phage prohead protease
MNNQSNEFTDRLVTLSDGRQGLRGTITTEVREPSPSPGGEGRGEGGISQASILEFTSSDETLDRYGEIITASGWKLANYQRNPVFQNSHQYGDILFTLGRAITTEVRQAKLYQRIQFATDVNPVAKLAYGLYKGKFLSAVSVGFVPLLWENGTQETPYRRKYIEQELLEVSAVSIPANPNALALAYKSGAIEKSDIRELSQLLLSVSITAGTHEKREFEHLLSLANTITTLLKRI